MRVVRIDIVWASGPDEFTEITSVTFEGFLLQSLCHTLSPYLDFVVLHLSDGGD